MTNKFIFIAFFSFLTSMIFLSSCQKASILESKTESTDKLPVVGFSENKVPFDVIHKNPDDLEDEKICLSKIAFAKELLDAARDKDFVKFVVDKAKQNEGFVTVDKELEFFLRKKFESANNFGGNET